MLKLFNVDNENEFKSLTDGKLLYPFSSNSKMFDSSIVVEIDDYDL